MHLQRDTRTECSGRLRAIALVIALAWITAFTLPPAAVAAQTPAASGGSGVVDIVPATALFFASAELDQDGAQFTQAMTLLERAGLTSMLQDNGMMIGEGLDTLPANAAIGLVVTSIPETSDLDITGVAANPASATDTLDEGLVEQGGYALIVRGDNMQSLLQGHEGEMTKSEYGGITITTFTPAAQDEETDSTATAMVGDYAVIASAPEDIQPLIATYNGDVDSLASDEHYQQLMALLPDTRLVNGFLNGPAFVETGGETADALLPALGDRTEAALNSWSAFSLSAEEQGFRLESRSMPATGAFEEISPLSGDFLDAVPSDSLFVTSGTDINSTGLLTSLGLLFAGELAGQDPFATPVAGTPAPTDADQVFSQTESLLGFNLKTDFIDHLVGEYGIAISVGDLANPAGAPDIDAIIMSHVDNPAAVQDVVSKVSLIIGAAMGDAASITTRDVDGSTVNVADLSETGIADRAEFGVVDSTFIISLGSGLETYLQGPSSPLSSDPTFNAVMEHLPDSYGTITYVNVPGIVGVVNEFSGSLDADVEDANPACGDYATQEEAQAAYDADQFENFMLDQDFDGMACEDYFAPASATPANPASQLNIGGLATVTTQEDGVNRGSTFLLIGEGENGEQ